MTSFKFPPPPPPPPKASPSNAQDSCTSQRGGHNDGRGGRGRGRGRGSQGRGRGNNNFRGESRGGYGQGDGLMNGNGFGRGHVRGGFQNNNNNNNNNTRGGYQQQNQIQGHISQQSPTQPGLPNGPNTTGASQSQVDPMAFAQAMAFMSNPAGMQSMANFANQMATAASAASQQSPHPQFPQSPPQYSPMQHAGHKRKRNERNNVSQRQSNPQQQNQKPPKAKAAPPPPVPSFGFSLPTAPPAQSKLAPQTNSRADQQKRKVNLGLTHQGAEEEDEDSDSEEDVDEEAAFAANLKGEGIVFEHDGVDISLQTPAEMAAWIKDRRKNFPTQKRIAQKAEEAAIKRAGEIEFLRKIKGKASNTNVSPLTNAQPDGEGKRKESQEKQDELAQLRKKLHESVVKKNEMFAEQAQGKMQSIIKSIDLGLGYGSETESGEDESSELEESSVVSSSEEPSDESDSESESDSDAPPEEQSSKVAPKVIVKRPPLPTAHEAKIPAKETKQMVCTHWEKTGRCKYRKQCRFSHPPREEPKRKGLYEKMVEQELEKADRFALDAIKYLGRHGYLG